MQKSQIHELKARNSSLLSAVQLRPENTVQHQDSVCVQKGIANTLPCFLLVCVCVPAHASSVTSVYIQSTHRNLFVGSLLTCNVTEFHSGHKEIKPCAGLHCHNAGPIKTFMEVNKHTDTVSQHRSVLLWPALCGLWSVLMYLYG